MAVLLVAPCCAPAPSGGAPQVQQGPARSSAAPAEPSAAPAEPAAPPVAEDATPEAPTAAATIAWQLEIEPKSMKMAQRDACRIRITATNEGAAPASPPLHEGEFTVNGQPSMGLSLAFGNGAREAGWSSLPPGQSVSTSRAACRLFDKPGRYTVGFEQGASKLAFEVVITP